MISVIVVQTVVLHQTAYHSVNATLTAMSMGTVAAMCLMYKTA